MKNYLYGALTVALLWLTAKAVEAYGMLPGLFMVYFPVLGAWFLFSSIRDKRRIVKEAKYYGGLVHDIIVASRDPWNDDENKTVFLRAQQERQKLEASGNKFAKVIPIYFRDHMNPCETPEEYQERVKVIEQENQKKKAKQVVMTEGEEFYLWNVLKQRV